MKIVYGLSGTVWYHTGRGVLRSMQSLPPSLLCECFETGLDRQAANIYVCLIRVVLELTFRDKLFTDVNCECHTDTAPCATIGELPDRILLCKAVWGWVD